MGNPESNFINSELGQKEFLKKRRQVKRWVTRLLQTQINQDEKWKGADKFLKVVELKNRKKTVYKFFLPTISKEEGKVIHVDFIQAPIIENKNQYVFDFPETEPHVDNNNQAHHQYELPALHACNIRTQNKAHQNPSVLIISAQTW